MKMDNYSFSDGSVADFYAGRSIFVTGGTGFLGKVMIEKLLRSCNRVGNIYILVRDKKNEIAEQRLHKITEEVLFDKIRNENPQSLKKLIPVRGDLTEPRLIVSDEQYDEIIENVSVVFHVGATVKFNEPLKQAMLINVEGTRKVVSLCRKLKKLVALLHISTAYCNTNKDIVKEIVYPPPATLDEVYSFLDEYGDEDQERVAKFLKDNPNTYTFTKHLGEYEVFSNSDAIPAAIIRPSVVTPIMKDPVSGWLDTWNGTTLYLLGISKGQIRFLRGDRSQTLDLIPVDMVANMSIVAATRAKKKDLKVYNCCSGSKNPLSYNKITQTTIDISLQRNWIKCENDEEDSKDYEITIMKALLSDVIDESGSKEILKDDEEQPSLTNGVWRCGECDNIEDYKLIYTEKNQAVLTDTDQPFEIQVQVAAEGMRCVEIQSRNAEDMATRRASGSCSGAYALLSIKPQTVREFEFVVSVYGN